MSVEQKAVRLYAVAERDVVDFMDFLHEEGDPKVIQLLYQMMMSWNPDATESDRKLNATLGPMVGRRLDELAIPRPEVFKKRIEVSNG